MPLNIKRFCLFSTMLLVINLAACGYSDSGGCKTDQECSPPTPYCDLASGDCVACLADCSKRECGPDPACGTSCGECTGGKVCQEGLCICKPRDSSGCHQDDVWWFDSCGNPESLITDCPQGCSGSQCTDCTPDCGSRECGPDPMCGASCGVCTDGNECQNGSCGCASRASVGCHNGDMWWLDSCGVPEELITECTYGCKDGQCQECMPDCSGRECGPDPICGTSCGECIAPESCGGGGQPFVCGCMPQCLSKCCGDDGCGGICPDLCGESGQTCDLESCSCTGGGVTADYYPLDVGMRWIFETSDEYGWFIEIVSRSQYAGRESLEVHSYAPGYYEVDTYQYKEGDDVYLFMPGYSDDWVLAIDGPPEEGKRWSYQLAGMEYEFEWESIGSISVPAGDFDDCYRVVTVSSPVDNYTVYAPDVGPVYSVSGYQVMWLVQYEI